MKEREALMDALKYPAREALQVIDGPIAKELSIHRFDDIKRSKAHLFAIGGPLGQQFAVVLGNTNVDTGFHPAQQTRVVLQKCTLPALRGIEPCDSPYDGSRIKNNQDSKLAAQNHTSCIVYDEDALKALLRWYAEQALGKGGEHASSSLERTRIEKAAVDAGFDLTPDLDDGWLLFRSTSFSVQIGVLARTDGYDVGVSEETVGRRLAGDLGVEVIPASRPWVVRLNGLSCYNELHQALQRGAQIAHAVCGNPLSEFEEKTKQLLDSTEIQRLAKQRVGQDIFRRELIGYWGGRCAVTGLDVVELLRASHIKCWAKCESDSERLDVFNGLLLAPHLDALFDGGWVTFLNSGQIQVSVELSSQQRAIIGLTGTERVQGLTEKHASYLAWHRDNCFRKA